MINENFDNQTFDIAKYHIYLKRYLNLSIPCRKHFST